MDRTLSYYQSGKSDGKYELAQKLLAILNNENKDLPVRIRSIRKNCQAIIKQYEQTDG